MASHAQVAAAINAITKKDAIVRLSRLLKGTEGGELEPRAISELDFSLLFALLLMLEQPTIDFTQHELENGDVVSLFARCWEGEMR